MRISNTDDYASFSRLQQEWDDLLSASRQDGPFLRHAWLDAWWRTHGGDHELHVLTCRDDAGRLLGVMPCYRARMGRLVPVRRLRFLADGDVGSTCLTPFARPDVEDEVFAGLLSHLRQDSEWDVLDLRFLDPHQAFFGKLTQRPMKVYHDCGACPLISLPRDWEAYLQMLQPRKRQNVRRSLRRIDEAGIGLEVIERAEDVRVAVNDLLRLRDQRVRKRLGESFVASEAFRDFTMETTMSLLHEGRLRLLFLRLGEQRIAVNHMFRYGDTMYGEQAGFDDSQPYPDLMRPLQALAIKRAIEEGCDTFDMLLGDQDYKLDWGAHNVRELVKVHVYHRSLPAWVRLGRDSVLDGVRGAAKAVPATR